MMVLPGIGHLASYPTSPDALGFPVFSLLGLMGEIRQVIYYFRKNRTKPSITLEM
jgi:hypothetical protein